MSYADMITILMAFFVVMYSMAGTPDEAKEEAVFRSLREQFGPMIRGWQAMGHGPLVDRLAAGPIARWSGARRQSNSKGGAENRGPRGEHPRVHSLRPGEQEADRRNGLLRRRVEHAHRETETTTTNHRRGTRRKTTKNRNPGTHLAPATAARCPVS